MDALVIKQAGKFVLVGILNTLIDLGVLNLLIFITGIASGFGYSAFKGISFTVAVVNSYILNKFWTFSAFAKASADKKSSGREFSQFFIVSVIGFGINVGVASLVVNVIGNPFTFSGVSDTIWANVGAIVATFCAMAWNFLGYKFIVFKS